MKQVVNVFLVAIVLQVLVLTSLVLVNGVHESFVVEDLGQNH